MPHFSYQAIDSAGKPASGVIEADSARLAEEKVASGGLIPIKVSETSRKDRSSGGSLPGRGRVKPHELVLFTKQLRAMHHAGIPIIRIFQVLEAQTENRVLRKALADMLQDIKTGSPLYDTLKKHPSIFPPLYCSMVHAGEVSGTVSEVLDRLSYILEHENKVKSDIRSAMQYPALVVIALVIAFLVLLTFVIPKFEIMFSRAGLTLPLPTRIAIALYHFLSGYWPFLLLGAIGIFFGLRSYLKTEQGRFVKDSLLLKAPVFGPLFIKAAMSRFASIFAILQASGVPVIKSMNILSGTIGNAAIARAFDSIGKQLEEGRGISGPLANANYFTPMVVDMVAIGEESGNIDGMLREISSHYDEEVRHAVSRMADALGPVLVVALAVVVGFFALAIFMPMWDMTKMVQ